jgi:hypothetical protein
MIWDLLYKRMGGYRLAKDLLRRNILAESITEFWGYGELFF